MLFLDAEISRGVLDALVTQQNLRDFEVGGLAVDVGDAGAAQRVRAVDGWIKVGEGDPVFDQAAVPIHRKPHPLVALLRAEEGITIGFVLGLDQLLQSLARIIPQTETHPLAGLALINGDALFDVVALNDVGDIERHDIDAAQTGVDGEREHGDVSEVAVLGEEGADRRDLLRREGRFSSDDFALVPGSFALGHRAEFYTC